MLVCTEPGQCKLHIACHLALHPRPQPDKPKARPMQEYKASRYLTDEQITHLQDLARGGWTCLEISRMSGRALSTIHKYCAHLAPKGRRHNAH